MLMNDYARILTDGITNIAENQSEKMEDVVSPANLPEFMERMMDVWQLRHGNEFVFS